MKLLFSVIVLLAITISSCSSSRYGRVPKGKKQKHTVDKKQFRKKKAYSKYELLKSKKVEVEYNTNNININQLKNASISPNIISTQLSIALSTPSIAVKKERNRNTITSSLFKPVQPQGAHIQKITKRINWWSGAMLFGAGFLLLVITPLLFFIVLIDIFELLGLLLILVGIIMMVFFS